MRINRRHGITSIVGTMIMVAIVTTLGVLSFTYASGAMSNLSGNYSNAMTNQVTATKEKFAVEEAAFTFPSMALDGSNTKQAAGSSGSIFTTLTTTSSNDVLVAYVSPADLGTATPPAVSGITGGGLTWTHRVTTPAETYPREYIPITLTNNVGPSALALDGKNYNTQTTPAATISATLTTSSANDVIIAICAGQNTATGTYQTPSMSGASLTWNPRGTEYEVSSVGGYSFFAEVFYALTSSALSTGPSLTCTWNSAPTHYAILQVFGVSGANMAAPFDTHSGLPAWTTDAWASVSTTNLNDFVFGLEQTNTLTNPGSGTGFTGITSGVANSYFASEYEIVSSAQSGLSMTYTGSASYTDGAVGDAIQAPPTTATPSTFQQMVTWNPSSLSAYETSDLGNIRFCADTVCASPLYAWLESCTSSCSPSATSATAWVKLTSSIAGGGGTLTIYMVFNAASTDFDGNYWGEAPQLSSTYAQYDNGGKVFTFYDNFASLSSANWQTIINGGSGTVSASNGLAISETSDTTNAVLASQSTYSPAVLDVNLELSSIQTDRTTPTLFYATTLPTTTGGDYGFQTDYRFDYYTYSTWWRTICDVSGSYHSGQNLSPSTLPSTYNVWSATWSATGSEAFAFDYAPVYVWADSGITYGSAYIGVAALQGGLVNAYWLRLRAYPPANVMPSLSFGSIPAGTYVPITLTNTASSSSLALDGSNYNNGNSGASLSASLTTAKYPDVIVVVTTAQDSGAYRTLSSAPSATGLTFSQRGSTYELQVNGEYETMSEWYAIASSTFSSSITVTYSTAPNGYMEEDVFGVSGANTASPFDSYSGLPSQTSTTAASITTSNANDFAFGFEQTHATGSPTTGSGWSAITSGITNGCCMASEYQVVSSTQSGLTVTWSNAASDANVMLGDAIQESGSTPTPFQQMVTWDPATFSAYEASNLGNVRFCADTVCVSPLYAWLEGCGTTAPYGACSTSSTQANAWVKLTSSIAPNNGQLTIYLVFYSTTTNFDDNYWGEAPSLSSTYAQYDNGANVFLAYADGNTAVSSFTVASGYTLAQTTGVTFGSGTISALKSTGSGTFGNIAWALNTNIPNQGVVEEGIMQHIDTSNDVMTLALTDSTTSSNNAIGEYSYYSGSYFAQEYSVGGTKTLDQNQQGTGTQSWVYFTVTYTGSGATTYSGYISPQFYSSTGGYTGTVTANPFGSSTNLCIADAFGNQASTPNNYYFDLVRARTYPPGGTMPTVSVGSPTTSGVTYDVEEWYATSSSPLSSVTVTATLSASDTAATWIAVFGISGAWTTNPFDTNPSVPATASATTPSTTVSTSNANDVLLYACAASSGGMASGFSGIFSNTYPPNQNEFVGYQMVSSTQTNFVTSCGTNSYGAELTDAVVASAGADVYVRNAGTIPTTLASVYIFDQSTGTQVGQFTVGMTVSVGTYADVTRMYLHFYPSHGHTYMFTVASSMGNSVVYSEQVT